jgi:uncharacterized C2H2 Zn-finger protein
MPIQCPDCGAQFNTKEEHSTHHERAHGPTALA